MFRPLQRTSSRKTLWVTGKRPVQTALNRALLNSNYYFTEEYPVCHYGDILIAIYFIPVGVLDFVSLPMTNKTATIRTMAIIRLITTF